MHFESYDRSRENIDLMFDQMQENGSLPGVVAQILRDKARAVLRENAATADQTEQEVSSGTGEDPGASSEQEKS